MRKMTTANLLRDLEVNLENNLNAKRTGQNEHILERLTNIRSIKAEIIRRTMRCGENDKRKQ